MPVWDEATLTPRQRQWFASVREGLECDTGRSLETWAEIARTCPETTPRARQRWLKTHHGLAQNRASMVLSAAFPPLDAEQCEADDPLWSDPAARNLLDAVVAVASGWADVVVGRRKGYTAISRNWQLAALRPVKSGAVILGLALETGDHARLSPRARESWSERLKSKLTLNAPGDVDADLAVLLHRAWERS